MSKLSGVPDTLFIPLAARIYSSKKFPHYFYDEKCLELEKEIPSSLINKKQSQYGLIASVARYVNFDEMIKNFIAKNNKCNIVNLGCGLETARFRIEDDKATFYEVDFPEVIKHRRVVLGEDDKEILLPYSLFDLNWVKHINKDYPTLLIASGVFQYLHEEDIIKFLGEIKIAIPGVEIIFDYTNSTGIKYTNRYVKKTGNKEAMMYFYIDDEKEFAKKVNSEIVDFRVFFSQARKQLKKGTNLYTKIAMKVCDDKKRACILQLKLK